MPQPKPKHLQLLSDLLDQLRSEVPLSELEFRRATRFIGTLKDRAVSSYLYALAYAAKGDKLQACEFFDECLNYKELLDAPNNYLTYLEKNCSVWQVQNVSGKVAEHLLTRMKNHPKKTANFNELRVLEFCFESNLTLGNIPKATIYYLAYKHFSENAASAKIDGFKETAVMSQEMQGMLENIELFKSRACLNDEQFSLISLSAVKVIERYNVSITAFLFRFMQEERTNCYILTTNTKDVELLADMNIDLAFELAEHEELSGKHFSAWFKGYKEEPCQ